MGLIAVKKEVWKKDAKKELKEERGPRKENRDRTVGPLKNKKTRHQNIRKPGNQRGGSNTP